MNIISVAFSGSNPSLGPHDTSSSKTLGVSPYPDELKALLDDTRVNGAATLREFLQMHLDGRSDDVDAVIRAYDEGDLEDGARIINLDFRLADGQSVSLQDLRTFSLVGDGYQQFSALIREHGTVSDGSKPVLKSPPKPSN